MSFSVSFAMGSFEDKRETARAAPHSPLFASADDAGGNQEDGGHAAQDQPVDP